MRRAVGLVWSGVAWLLGAMLALSTRLVLWSVRLEPLPLPDGPVVLACWHRHLPLTIPLAGRRRCWTMMSPAPYMAPIAAWARLLGVRLVRGTSGAGGQEALEELAQKVRDGDSVLLAVDGPRGPAFVAKSGCARLADETGASLWAIGYKASRSAEFPTWDRQLWPLPFSRVEVAVVPVDSAAPDKLLLSAQRALDLFNPDKANA